MPHASCLMPHASCLMPHASCLMPVGALSARSCEVFLHSLFQGRAKRAGPRQPAGVRAAAREVAPTRGRRTSRLARAAVKPGNCRAPGADATLRPFGPRRRRRAPVPGNGVRQLGAATSRTGRRNPQAGRDRPRARPGIHDLGQLPPPVVRLVPAAVSQIRAVRSPEAVASKVPSGENATALTVAVWPCSVVRLVPAAVS